jgi:hypothetical protein
MFLRRVRGPFLTQSGVCAYYVEDHKDESNNNQTVDHGLHPQMMRKEMGEAFSPARNR